MVQLNSFEHLLIFLLKVIFKDIDWLKPTSFSIFMIRAHRAHSGAFLLFFRVFSAFFLACNNRWLHNGCFLANWEWFPDRVLIWCCPFHVSVAEAIWPDFVEQILDCRRLIREIFAINVRWRVPGYYLSYGAVKTIHSRNKSVQRLREFVSFHRVLSESMQNLVFSSVLEFFPVFEAVKIGKKLALGRVAQIR